jgi:hypothetical protein
VTQSLKQLIADMKQLEKELSQHQTYDWKDYCGYEINNELSPFIYLTEEEIQYA